MKDSHVVITLCGSRIYRASELENDNYTYSPYVISWTHRTLLLINSWCNQPSCIVNTLETRVENSELFGRRWLQLCLTYTFLLIWPRLKVVLKYCWNVVWCSDVGDWREWGVVDYMEVRRGRSRPSPYILAQCSDSYLTISILFSSPGNTSHRNKLEHGEVNLTSEDILRCVTAVCQSQNTHALLQDSYIPWIIHTEDS